MHRALKKIVAHLMSSGMCQYKDVFGKPGEGPHSLRFAGVAVVDLGLTVAAAWAIARVWNLSIWKVLACLLVLGVVMHRMFCVNTTVNKALFGSV